MIDNIHDFELKCWKTLEEEKPEIAKESVKKLIPFLQEYEDFDELAEAILQYPETWMDKLDEPPYFTFHFATGMSIRNFLRMNVARDNELPHVEDYPDGNWDNFYVIAIEKAVKSIVDENNNIR